jgi:hypothetical protein
VTSNKTLAVDAVTLPFAALSFAAHRLPNITAAGFGLAAWPELLACLTVVAAVSIFYLLKLKSQRPWLKVALVSLRAICTLGLMLIIFDATITRSREDRGRLLITTSDSPLMRLPDAGDGKTRAEVAAAFSRGMSDDAQLTERFAIDQTSADISGAAPAEAGRGSAPVSAVICITDGSDAGVREADSLTKAVAAPLFVVRVGADKQSGDVGVSFIDCGGAASLDVPQVITVTLYGRAASGRSTLVRLSDEAVVISQATINWKDDSESVSVPLVLSPRVEGLHRYTVKAEPLEGELNTENNEASFSLDVRRGVRRILFIENQPTWESKFIRRALEGNASIAVDYFAQVSRAAVLGRRQTEVAGNMRAILGDFKQLARYDAVIAGPLDNAALSEREAQNITQFVERRGGGLIILGGNDFNGSILSASSRLAHLSPAVVAINARAERGPQRDEPGAQSPDENAKAASAVLSPTAEGQSLFFNPANNLAIDKLGPLSDSYLRVKAIKPGAVALAVDGAGGATEKPVLIAAQAYGYGRAMLFAPADSWRIQLAESAENKGLFDVLWQNVAFWAAGNAEPACNIRLQTSAIEAGDMLRAYLTVRDDSFNPVSSLGLKAAIRFDAQGGEVINLPVTVASDPSAPGVYELSATAGDEGGGDLSVESEAKGGGARQSGIRFMVQAKKSEWREPFDAGGRLARAAQATGGQLFGADQLDLLKSRLLELPPERRTSPVVHHLRDSIALAFLLPLLMALEYFLRRRYLGD